MHKPPWVTLITLVIVLTTIIVLIVTGHSDEPLITVLSASLPGLVAAGYAERASHDIRNGTVEEKAREGSKQALVESGLVSEEDMNNHGR